MLLALADGVEFVATWYAAQKIGAVTAEVYTFLPAKDFAYYLDYTRGRRSSWRTTTTECARPGAGDRPAAHGASSCAEEFARRGELRRPRREPRLDPAPTTKDDIALWKFTTGSTGLPKGAVHPVHSPLRSFEWYAQGVLDIREDDVVLPVPKLFFGYARDLAALYPFGVGAAGIVFPERSTPERIFELIADHRPTILVNVPTMMAQMLDRRHGRCQAPDLSCLRLCTSAGEALPRGAARPLAGHVRRRGARRDRLVRAVPHLHLEPARPQLVPGRLASSCRATRRSSTRTASCSSRATRPRSCTGTIPRRRSAPSTATPSAPATSSRATTTGSSGTAAEPTT